MQHIRWTSHKDAKRPEAPIMIVALEGLFDIAEGATDALHHLITHTDAELFATIDSEEFFDFTRERPTMRLAGGRRRITWPDAKCFVATFDDPAKRDLVLLVGVEPHLRWKTFAACVTAIAERLEVSTLVTMGSPPGQAPHTRPLGVVGSTTNNDLASRLGLGQPTYQGPTGLVGVLHELLDRRGMPSFSLKVSVPHYVTSPPNPEASRSLLARLELITGIDTEHEAFDDAAVQWREKVDSAVEADDEIAHYVRALEREVDSSDDILPTGSDLAHQLEAFLRGQES